MDRVQVKARPDGSPENITRNGHTEAVDVCEHWRIIDRWWGKELRRDYFRIVTRSGLISEIFRDMDTEEWFMPRGV